MKRTALWIVCALLSGPVLAVNQGDPDPNAEAKAAADAAAAALAAQLQAQQQAQQQAQLQGQAQIDASRTTQGQALIDSSRTTQAVGLSVHDGPTAQLVNVDGDGPVDQSVELSELVSLDEQLMIEGDELSDLVKIEGDEIQYEAAEFPVNTAYAAQGSECYNTYGAQGEQLGLSLSRVPKICKHEMASRLWVGMAELIATACTEGQRCAEQLDHAMNRAFQHLEAISDKLDVVDDE